VSEVRALHTTLDREVLTLLRGASLECLVCGEFVQHRLGVIVCPECGAEFGRRARESGLQCVSQAG
jgi:hypothetical protein